MLCNKTRNQRVIEKTRFASTPWRRLKGLMFENTANFDYALVFTFTRESTARAAIHMFFVFFPIDAVFLDRNRKVVDIALGLKPFTPSYTPKKPAKFLVELPAGKARGIGLGDELQW